MSWPQQPVAGRRTCVRCHQSGDSVKTKSTCLLKDDFVVIHICCSLPQPCTVTSLLCGDPLHHKLVIVSTQSSDSTIFTLSIFQSNNNAFDFIFGQKGFICGWVSYFLYKNIVRHARLYGKKFMCIYIHTHMSINQMWQIKKVMSNHVFEECIGMNERMKWVWLTCCVYNTIHTN